MAGRTLSQRVAELEERTQYIEDQMGIVEVPDEKIVAQSRKASEKVSAKKSAPSKPIDFAQVITVLGILGIIIAAFSFYFYGVARGLIGPTAQIGIGIIVGLGLFFAAFLLREKHLSWSNIVFGGAFFIEYLSIGVGVLNFEVIPSFLGVVLSLLFLVSGVILTIKFNSRVIAYFSFVGGYLLPYITGIWSWQNEYFIMAYYIVLSIGLVFISLRQGFSDVRFASAIFMGVYVAMTVPSSHANPILQAFYLIVLLVLFNISSVVSSTKQNLKLSGLDSITIGAIPLVFIPQFADLFNLHESGMGLLAMFFAFGYLLEIAILKSKHVETVKSLTYTILAAGYITLNVGLFFVLGSIDESYYLILFAIEWFLFSKLSEILEEVDLYKVGSYIFLAASILWVYEHRWISTIQASAYMVLYALMLAGMIYFYKKKLDGETYGVISLLFGFGLIWKFVEYLDIFIRSGDFTSILLSVLWLIYTLVLLTRVDDKQGRTIIGVLLGITLLKIAARDLLLLDGFYRIIGFMIFGILLLIGGYFIKHESR